VGHPVGSTYAGPCSVARRVPPRLPGLPTHTLLLSVRHCRPPSPAGAVLSCLRVSLPAGLPAGHEKTAGFLANSNAEPVRQRRHAPLPEIAQPELQRRLSRAPTVPTTCHPPYLRKGCATGVPPSVSRCAASQTIGQTPLATGRRWCRMRTLCLGAAPPPPTHTKLRRPWLRRLWLRKPTRNRDGRG
jgi:hypothetical protein